MLGVNAAMDVIGKVKGAVEGLAGNFQSFETAMVQVNTMAGKDAEGLAGLTDQVRDLSILTLYHIVPADSLRSKLMSKIKNCA